MVQLRHNCVRDLYTNWSSRANRWIQYKYNKDAVQIYNRHTIQIHYKHNTNVLQTLHKNSKITTDISLQLLHQCIGSPFPNRWLKVTAFVWVHHIYQISDLKICIHDSIVHLMLLILNFLVHIFLFLPATQQTNLLAAYTLGWSECSQNSGLILSLVLPFLPMLLPASPTRKLNWPKKNISTHFPPTHLA